MMSPYSPFSAYAKKNFKHIHISEYIKNKCLNSEM